MLKNRIVFSDKIKEFKSTIMFDAQREREGGREREENFENFENSLLSNQNILLSNTIINTYICKIHVMVK